MHGSIPADATEMARRRADSKSRRIRPPFTPSIRACTSSDWSLSPSASSTGRARARGSATQPSGRDPAVAVQMRSANPADRELVFTSVRAASASTAQRSRARPRSRHRGGAALASDLPAGTGRRSRRTARGRCRGAAGAPRPKGCATLPAAMSTDTKAIIGTIVGTGLALAGLLSAQIAGVNARVDDVRADMREMRASMERFDSRLDAVEVALGKVDQRLLTIERVVLPSATPDE